MKLSLTPLGHIASNAAGQTTHSAPSWGRNYLGLVIQHLKQYQLRLSTTPLMKRFLPQTPDTGDSQCCAIETATSILRHASPKHRVRPNPLGAQLTVTIVSIHSKTSHTSHGKKIKLTYNQRDSNSSAAAPPTLVHPSCVCKTPGAPPPGRPGTWPPRSRAWSTP